MRKIYVAALVMFTVGAAMAPGTGVSAADPPNKIVIENHNWWATSVLWYCNGSLIKVSHITDQPVTHEEIKLSPCQSVSFVVRGRGNRSWRSGVLSVPDGSTLVVRIEATMNLTNFYLRSYALSDSPDPSGRSRDFSGDRGIRTL